MTGIMRSRLKLLTTIVTISRYGRRNRAELDHGNGGLHIKVGCHGPFEGLIVFRILQDIHNRLGRKSMANRMASALLLPASVFGPVLFIALRRLASIRLSEVMGCSLLIWLRCLIADHSSTIFSM